MSQSVSSGEKVSSVDALLADYACGRLASSLHALVATHIALRPCGASFVAGLEALHGCELERMETSRRSDVNGRRLAAIMDGETAAFSQQKRLQSTILPRPLYDFIGRDLTEIRWRTKLPGLKEYHVETSDGFEASLLWIGAGRKMLSHTPSRQ